MIFWLTESRRFFRHLPDKGARVLQGPGEHASVVAVICFFFSSRRRHTRFDCDWSSDVCSSDLGSCRRMASPPRAFPDGKAEPVPQFRSLFYVPGSGSIAAEIMPNRDSDYKLKIGRASCRERV